MSVVVAAGFVSGRPIAAANDTQWLSAFSLMFSISGLMPTERRGNCWFCIEMLARMMSEFVNCCTVDSFFVEMFSCVDSVAEAHKNNQKIAVGRPSSYDHGPISLPSQVHN